MLVAVYEEPLLAPLVPGEMGWRTMAKQARAMLAETRDSLAPHARVVVESGALPWRALREVVRREHRDLLVVGSARPADEAEVRLGKTAKDLSYHLDCALAIAPHGMRSFEKRRLERIGVGFDDTPEAQAALELAAGIAGAAGAGLEVRGVVDDRVSGGLRTAQVVLGGREIVAEQEVSLRDRALAATQATGLAGHVEVGRGDPAEALRALGDTVDLTVIGSGHSGPRGRVYLGATGSAFVDGAPCPVLIAPRPDR